MEVLRLLSLCILFLAVNGELKCESGAIDLVFVMDQSGSIGRADYKRSLAAAAQLTTELTIGTAINDSRVGFVLFDDRANVAFGLTDLKTNAEVENNINGLPYSGGGTNIAIGMKAAMNMVFTSAVDRGVPKVMLLVTDGQDNTNVAFEQARAANKNISIYALGVGSGVDIHQLELATGNPANVYQVANYSNLEEVMDQICIEVLPSIAPPANQSPHSPHECECNYKKTWLDLVFLVDSSQAVSTQDFNAARNFLASFVKNIPVGQQLGAFSRVAIVNVGAQAHRIADLKAFQTSADAAKAMRSLVHLKDKSVNMQAGLVEAEDIIAADERKNVQNVVVVFTSNPIDCAHYEKSKILSKLQAKLQEKDPCRIAAHLRESGNIVLTVGMKFDGIGAFPIVDITSPCYSLNYDTSMAKKFIQLMCKANCYCLPPYIQFKDDDKCMEYGECLYLQGNSLTYQDAEDTCATYNSRVADVLNEDKEAFLQEEHKAVSYYPFWIGASALNGPYEWNNGQTMSSGDYTNWAPSQPDKGAGLCVVEKADQFKSLWYSEECDDFITTNYFSCQKNACSTENYCEFDK